MRTLSNDPPAGPVPAPTGPRRTKIVATVGPASDSRQVLAAMRAAGMDMARVTLAHGATSEAVERVRNLREAVPEVSVLVDLPGPKIRAAPFPVGGVVLETGAEVTLVPGGAAGLASSAELIPVSYPALLDGLEPGDRVALGDGGVALTVRRRDTAGVAAAVESGGLLQGRPGITAPAGRLTLETPTPEDLERVEVMVGEEVDAIAISFVRGAEDVVAVRRAAERAAERAGAPVPMLVAKMETPEAIADLDAIVDTADAVMVARGDLGVRMALEDIPHSQKRIIRSAVRFGRPVITATQMLESMVTASSPTRAEVTDVANAVLDGTSAVMLSGETAVGVDPAGVVATMARIARRAEQDFDYLGWGTNLGAQEVAGDPSSTPRITAAITAAAWRAAVEEDAVAVIACTRTGATARAISRFRPPMPIIGATPSSRTARQLAISWGVVPLLVGEASRTDEIVWFAVQSAVRAGFAAPGDVVVVLAGSPTEAQPTTDTLRLVRVH
ncbi:MAG TPA: pyruvate kinase [Acidimicrobiales bacterium]|nr:pyruvate kinase [Acidimicrobiales bacterium]